MSGDIVPASPLPEGLEYVPGRRVGDQRRTEYVNHLSDCWAQGLLDQEEFHRRLALAEAARNEQQLTVLLADLPALPEPRPRRERPAKTTAEIRYRRRTRRTLVHALAGVLLACMGAVVPCVASIPDGWSSSDLRMTAFVAAIIVAFAGIVGDIIWYAAWYDHSE